MHVWAHEIFSNETAPLVDAGSVSVAVGVGLGGGEMNLQRDKETDEKYQARLLARIIDLQSQLAAEREAREAAEYAWEQERDVTEMLGRNLEQAQRELDAERKDAERYRLVRLLPGNEELMSLLESICADPTSPEQFDATIDAARKEGK